jgi:hypothetical protein
MMYATHRHAVCLQRLLLLRMPAACQDHYCRHRWCLQQLLLRSMLVTDLGALPLPVIGKSTECKYTRQPLSTGNLTKSLQCQSMVSGPPLEEPSSTAGSWGTTQVDIRSLS